jgi:lysophospholipase L1-like esterase
MMRSLSRGMKSAAAALAITLGLSATARADVYLSLGDSVGFGETVFSPGAPGAYADPSFGDRGYVGMFADYLGTQDGGNRPMVVNLAVDGETLSSFFTGSGRVPPAAGITDAQLAGFNLNYTGSPLPTQDALLTSTLGTQAASIHNITISLGSNDLFGLALTDPNAAADLPAALAAFKTGYEALVNGLHAAAPNASIYVLGTYNPFTADPLSPFAGLASVAIPMLNATDARVAADTGAYFVPIFNTPLTNDAANYTLITTFGDLADHLGDVHPNFDKGYAVIAGAIEAVPEPSTLALTAIGLAGVVVARMRCRRLS